MNSIEPPSFTTFQLINYAQFGQTELVFLLILCILLLLSALISGSEAAFFSLSPKDKEALKEDDGKKAAYTTRLLKKPKELLATILITNNFVNVAIVILSSSLLNKLSAHSDSIEALRFLFEVVLITFVLLILGEVIPKIYATKNALGFSKMMGRFLFFLNKTPPISWIRLGLVSSSGFIQRKFKKRMVDISSDELEAALALTKESDTEDDDHKILEGIVNFGKTEVRQIMKPRLDVYAIETTSSFKEVY